MQEVLAGREVGEGFARQEVKGERQRGRNRAATAMLGSQRSGSWRKTWNMGP
jgi:hypothetical protein